MCGVCVCVCVCACVHVCMGKGERDTEAVLSSQKKRNTPPLQRDCVYEEGKKRSYRYMCER